MAVRLNGAVKTDPNETPLVKNCTLVTVPLLTVALAAMFTFAKTGKTAPLAGLVMLTVGKPTTVMFTTVEVAEIPDAIATAVKA